ncbi:DEAD/DEAH box helicase [uncultured Corynebacterium sp.]|uniref:DEAD/DEAH box helicase n=1 Tax=uncultured Corynebacterium sp. TaxID=159447 RepID=UPI0025F048C8|nr:DEAD/DEAH box helicase [uncultured Corynebacterium sp.]
MSSYLLHGIWLPLSGLGLWIEQVEGHKIVQASAVPEGTFPEAVEAILSKKSFRNRARMTLRTPKGKDVSLMVPMGMFGPDETVVVLSQLAALEHLAGITAEQRATIAPDLRWLMRAYKGLAEFVRAGRVTLRLNYQSGEWLPMWQLASGLGERGWLAEMIAAAPGILTVNNRSLTDDMADELTHWIAYMELKDLQTAMRPYPWHEFVDSILHTTPVKRGRAQLLRGLNEWKDSITQVDLQLVFIVEEPPKEDAAATEIAPEDYVWPIRVQVRSGTDSPQPVRAGQLDRSSMEKLRDAQRRAIGIAKALDPAASKPAPRYFENAGDWDVYLSTEDLVNFVGEDAAALRTAGFTVMLPKAWAHMETKARLETRAPAGDAAESATRAHLGLDKLVEYDWKLSVGDTELTDEEMAQLVESKSGLIQLRGEWVMADTSALGRINEYMEQLAKTSRTRAKKELDQAMREALHAKELDLPGWRELLADVERRLEEFNAQAGDADLGQVTLAELRQLALEAMAREPIEFTGSGWFTSLLGGMGTVAPERVDIPDTVHAELRDYQRRGVDWLYWMSRNNIGAVLADDMGLGKTLQLLATIAVEKAAPGGEKLGPTLVIAPTSVVGNWAREAAKFVPGFSVLVQHGSQRLKDAEFIEQAPGYDLVITSYGTAGRDFLTLGQVEWDRVVLDEAQAIKNSATQASKAVRSLPSRHRIALTGTPVENRLSEMRSILDFCNPGVLGSASFFRNHFAKAIERGEDPEMAERLRQLIAPFILRRLKTDPNIIDDLPEKSEQIITVSMTDEQAALYKALVDDIQRRLEEASGMRRRGLVLASLTRIKQICNHPAHYLGDGSAVTLRGKHRSGKVAELMRIVDEATESGERILVFTQYKAFGDILQPYLSQQLGRDIPFLHGGVTKAKRDAMVEEFQTPDGPPAMILSLKAGGTGLNLTAANIVVHMDRWWNPAVENQATDRAFRIGQERNVQVYKMITAGTLEESIQDILDGKMELAGAVVGEGEGWLTELSADQLADLMSYRGREA